jgi:stearoyl-CoA desaturase (delta-9 desaturase)
MLNGILDLPWWATVVVTLCMTHFTIASVTIYLHRHQAHRAIDLHPACAFIFRLWLWLTTGMTTKNWAAIHRKHHAFVDKIGDPHSPQTVGLWTVLSRGAELYREQGKDPKMLARYGHGTPDDWLERHVFGPHDRIGVATMLIINLTLFGALGLSVWAIQMAWIPIFAAGIINGAGHWSGYRNFETMDSSTNIVPWGILIGGEELHNNHHAFASSARFSVKPWEFDIGWLYISLLVMVGLANVKKLAPSPRLDRAKTSLDLDTLSALVGSRFHVMADYAKHVLKKVHREELQKAEVGIREQLKATRSLLAREQSLMDDRQRSLLEAGLQHSSALTVACEFREQLQQIFTERTATPERLLVQLQEWRRRAEATGIASLEDFAASLQCYTLSAGQRS